MISERALERVQIPAWNFHAIRVLGRIKQRKLPAELDGVHRLDARFTSRQKELLQPVCRNDRIMSQCSA
jgi:predicted FMN-binding regulatory protein PaiB